MLSQIDFKKDLKKQLFIGGSISLLLVGILIFLFFQLNSLAKEIASLEEEISRNQQMFANFSILKIQKKQVLPIQEKIFKMLPSKDEVLAIVGSIGDWAREFGLKQSFAFGSEHEDKETGLNSIGFNLTLNGSLDSFSGFLRKLESAPQFIQISSVEIIRAESGYQINSSGKIYKK
ncbi:MAG: hypothetical protein UX26_C0011G0022 [Parcubacteria group bacterium GW2011_GWC1_45_9]|nr:MAG: hypothetical protein UW85_C0003G0028 [Parcubacteria group bacterium GW2011_GWA1_Parcubacteria_45_10]KKT88819.1 MAG: hypothetical protein UW89_C0004G0018 [Parcubacteria group bacterium GW2011_GWB1_45_10]KKU16967.1 MAG: hypothetical protein UX26_C0011G0022 [Parcubacteria group bacterium GW2011_GWC1_45_9]HCI05148.1 hypothetical protein [Patescibacteria group bacterium]